jgi:hypothetical protein
MYASNAISQTTVAAASVARPATASFCVLGLSAPDLLTCRFFTPFRTKHRAWLWHSESSAVFLGI